MQAAARAPARPAHVFDFVDLELSAARLRWRARFIVRPLEVARTALYARYAQGEECVSSDRHADGLGLAERRAPPFERIRLRPLRTSHHDGMCCARQYRSVRI